MATSVLSYSDTEIQFLKDNMDILDKAELTKQFNKQFRHENWITKAQKPKTRAAIESMCFRIKKGDY